MKKILILVNDATTLLQFRCELVRALTLAGHEVVVSVPHCDRLGEIEALGAEVVPTEVARHGKNPLADIALVFRYKRLIKKLKPDVVLSYTVKPNVYGGMACAALKVKQIANVTGLGVVGGGGLMQKLTLWLYKKGLKKTHKVFFQNSANLEFFRERGIVKDNAVLLPGSGVNLEKFEKTAYPSDKVVNLLFVGRIIPDKGVNELAQVARALEEDGGVRFTVLGSREFGSANPFEGCTNVAVLDYDKNVKPYYEKAHAVVLPSYHEGMANVLLEASSVGRPILASDIPGCREAVEEGKTGFLFEPRSAEDLMRAVKRFLALTGGERKAMGDSARERMENIFDRKIVISKYFDEIE